MASRYLIFHPGARLHYAAALQLEAVDVLACKILSPGRPESPDRMDAEQGSFEGCGAMLRRSAFLETAGYVLLRYAYGMEELDLSLQRRDHGREIRCEDQLRVFHDADLSLHGNAGLNAASIRNSRLLMFLRSPLLYWRLGMAQYASRIYYSISKRRYAGILQGIITTPSACWGLRRMRKIVKPITIRKLRAMART